MSSPLQPYYTIPAAQVTGLLNSVRLSQSTPLQLNILLNKKALPIPDLLAALNNADQKFIFSLSADLAKDPVALKALLPACYLLFSMDLYATADAAFIPVLCESREEAFQTALLTDYFHS